jgi:LPS sulfotransferase NodH
MNGIRHALRERAFIKKALIDHLLDLWRGQDLRRMWLVKFLSNDFRWVWSLKFLTKPVELRGSAEFSSLRPDSIDLSGSKFDRDSPMPAQQTIILCSAPRTGSNELCRFLTAAGLGIPHEYFNPFPARRLMARWGLKEHPLSESAIASYIDMLRRRRANSDVFSTKLQYWQFDAFLRNRHGAALFKNACVVHLFRSDIVAQFASFRAAIETGQWDYSGRQITRPCPPPKTRTVEHAIVQLQSLVGEDAGFRKLFGLLGIRPIFITTEQLFADPQAVVASIARAVNVNINENALKNTIALSSPYPHTDGTKSAMNGIRHTLRERAFMK